MDRILGQILRQMVWDQLESRCSTSWRATLTTGHCCWWRAVSCPAWPLGRALLAARAPDPSLRVVSTEGNPDTPPRNEQQRTNDNDEELERPGQQRRGLARRVVSLHPPSTDAGSSKTRSRKEGLACPPSHHSGNYSARDGRTRHDTRDPRTGTTPSDSPITQRPRR